MLPDDELSSVAVVTGYSDPVKSPGDFLIDWERAGVYLNDSSQGLLVKVWMLRAVSGAAEGEMDVVLSAPGGVAPGEASRVLFSRPGITEVALSFDQNMNPFVAFVQAGVSKKYWYDSVAGQQLIDDLPSGARSPRCTIDDKRAFNTGNSDNILAYIRNGSLIATYQRDRYSVEHVLAAVGSEAELLSIAMNKHLRVQFRIRKASVEGDGWFLSPGSPILADVVSDLTERAGLDMQKSDVSQLWGDYVRGFTVGNAYSASGSLQTLSSVFFFDPFTAEGRVNFVPRGRDATATIIEEKMIDDEQPIEDGSSRRGDSINIPRVLHLNYHDVAGGLNTDKQRSERPEGTRADGEQSLQTPVILSADEAATVVARTHGLIVEQQKGELNFSLPDNWLRLTESDPVFVQTGTKMVRAIISRVETDDGEQRYKAIRDRQSLYTTNVQGIPAAPVTRPPSSVAGPTLIEFLDIPILRDTHDQLGFYLAVSGILPAWPGASVELSLDGGENYIEAGTTRTASIIGELLTTLGDHPFPFPDTHNVCQVEIRTPNALLENTTLTGMMNRRNRALIGNEIVNFAEADEVTPGTWELSSWLRGRKGTATESHAIGERFVLLDTAMFIPAELSWMGSDLTFRAITFGRPVEEATIVTVPFTGQSQVERRPAYLKARRDGTDAVIAWQGVGRLGGGAHVAMGAHFAGYRVTLTDGSTTQVHDTVANTLTLPLTAFSGPVAVSVQQRNAFTGLGPSIEVTI